MAAELDLLVTKIEAATRALRESEADYARILNDATTRSQQAELRLAEVRKSHIENLYDLEVKILNKETDLAMSEEEKLNAFKTENAKKNHLARLEAIEAEAQLEREKQTIGSDLATQLIQDEVKEKEKIQEKAKARLLKNKKKELKEIAELETKAANARDADEKARLEEQIKEKNEKLQKQLETQVKRDGEAAAKSAMEGSTKDLASMMGSAKTAIQEGLKHGTSGFGIGVGMMAGLAEQLDGQIDTIAAMKGAIDTRLNGWTMSGARGSASNLARLLSGGSYWGQMSKEITGYTGVSPLIKQKDLASNINSMVDKGIAYNVEQRAFLATISDKIATTFEATNGTLLRLVRVQQEDTTAARLGMEAALNSFLNNMYETTEYMGAIADGIKSNLEESMALMTARDAVGYEYQVQKWLGSMYSTGMSQTAVGVIGNAFGNLAAGKIEGITQGGAGNLLVMAANEANLSVADILAEGLNESETNKLMQAMVNYLGKLYNESKDSRVVQQQIANVYGISASDLKAAASLARSTKAISASSSNYGESLKMLTLMSSTMGKRTSAGEMLNNSWENLMYTLASGMASSPALYGIYKVGKLMNDVGAQMDIPEIAYLGTTVNLQTSIADLMEAGALAGSLLSGIGQMAVSGGGGGITGLSMLTGSGALNSNVVRRGGGINGLIGGSGITTSESGMIGNRSDEDIRNKTLSDANSEGQNSLQEQKDSSEDITIADVNDNVLLIYNLLNDFSESLSTGSTVLQVEIRENPFTLGNI